MNPHVKSFKLNPFQATLFSFTRIENRTWIIMLVYTKVWMIIEQVTRIAFIMVTNANSWKLRHMLIIYASKRTNIILCEIDQSHYSYYDAIDPNEQKH